MFLSHRCQWKTLRESQKAAQRTSHRLSRFQNVLTRRPFLTLLCNFYVKKITHHLGVCKVLCLFHVCHPLPPTPWLIQFSQNRPTVSKLRCPPVCVSCVSLFLTSHYGPPGAGGQGSLLTPISSKT